MVGWVDGPVEQRGKHVTSRTRWCEKGERRNCCTDIYREQRESGRVPKINLDTAEARQRKAADDSGTINGYDKYSGKARR